MVSQLIPFAHSFLNACDQQAVANGMDARVFYLRKSSAEHHELVLHEERHDPYQADFFLLTIGEAGQGLRRDDKLGLSPDTHTRR
jgi:hypothetical protein